MFIQRNIPHSKENEYSIIIHDNMIESQKYNVEWTEPDQKCTIWIYIKLQFLLVLIFLALRGIDSWSFFWVAIHYQYHSNTNALNQLQGVGFIFHYLLS